ncbi:hypothetical protein GTW43_32285 [Streptomyces sp. SID5785]|uniref:hypothetical protein n=1 Tax=Streptomyces sp. SID5785 TaxID=2690309 RepID=UPI0013618E85|nr:hypothetical protein [Streptomyces sp. SID5785]MZD09726.1 hypothetical protein [Streptomyces sp. SID5785]
MKRTLMSACTVAAAVVTLAAAGCTRAAGPPAAERSASHDRTGSVYVTLCMAAQDRLEPPRSREGRMRHANALAGCRRISSGTPLLDDPARLSGRSAAFP